MSSKTHSDLKQILHPYLFVLKEGKTIGDDFLDYSLIMLHVNCTEVLQSPRVPESKLALAPPQHGMLLPKQEPEQEPLPVSIAVRPKVT